MGGFMEQDTKSTKKQKKDGGSLGFARLNYILMAVGLGVIVIGYIFLATGDITIAPILLVIGYCGILPAAILIRNRTQKSSP
jgi:hypothetical protein